MTRSVRISESLPLHHAGELVKPDGFLIAMLCTIAVRALIVSLGILSVATAHGRIQTDNASGHPWIAWDGDHYLNILQHGYATTTDTVEFTDIAFFPLYPLSARCLATLTSMDPVTALVVLSNACAIIGFGFLYAWARALAGPRAAMVATLLCACYPGAVFFSAGLTEGPFFCMVAATLWLLQQRKFWWAAAVAALATATRPTGIALAAVVPIYAWTCLGHLAFSRRLATFVALGFVSVLGGLLYEAFLWHRFGIWDAYIHAQEGWAISDAEMVAAQEAAGIKRYSLQFFLDRIGQPQAWNRFIALTVLVMMLVGFFKRTVIPRTLFVLPAVIFLMTALPNNGLRASSIFRYESAAIPLFLLAATWFASTRRRPALLLLLGFQLIIQAYYAILFSRGLWVG